MIRLSLAELADVVGGELENPDDAGDAGRTVHDVTIDSRTAGDGSLFIALPGTRVDGHDFVADAVTRGASGYVRAAGHRPLGIPGGVVVDDTGDALLGLGRWVREEVDPVTVAITGSVGKTTTKDFVAATVGSARRVIANPGSYNNELGVPLTCCLLTRDTEVLVTEIGARGIGHIAALAPIVAPTIAVVTAVAAAHLELFVDLATVARAKQELVEALDPDGVAVLNADDPLVAAMAARTAATVRTYGLGADADWRAEDIELDELARPRFRVRGVQVQLGLPGEHNVGNALAALAVADAAGAPLADAAAALTGAQISRWRMELHDGVRGSVVLNDAYNANPLAMRAALATLARMRVDGRRWAVLGLMGELGASAHDEHAAIGRYVCELGIDELVVVGEPAQALYESAVLAGQGHATLVAGPDEALATVRAGLRPGDAVLVKASRSVGLERVAEAISKSGSPATGTGP